MPVLPEVGSMMVSPGLSWPFFSASSTILRAILSLTEPPALKNSHFATEMLMMNYRSERGETTLTELTLESRCLGDLVNPHHGSVADVVEDIRHHLDLLFPRK